MTTNEHHSVVNIRDKEMKIFEVAAAWRSDLLAVHHSFLGGHLSLRQWTLTHVPSGVRICSYSDKEKLIEIAQSPFIVEILESVHCNKDGLPSIYSSARRDLDELIPFKEDSCDLDGDRLESALENLKKLAEPAQSFHDQESSSSFLPSMSEFFKDTYDRHYGKDKKRSLLP